jgi:hypothetical protein
MPSRGMGAMKKAKASKMAKAPGKAGKADKSAQFAAMLKGFKKGK